MGDMRPRSSYSPHSRWDSRRHREANAVALWLIAHCAPRASLVCCRSLARSACRASAADDARRSSSSRPCSRQPHLRQLYTLLPRLLRCLFLLLGGAGVGLHNLIEFVLSTHEFFFKHFLGFTMSTFKTLDPGCLTLHDSEVTLKHLVVYYFISSYKTIHTRRFIQDDSLTKTKRTSLLQLSFALHNG